MGDVMTGLFDGLDVSKGVFGDVNLAASAMRFFFRVTRLVDTGALRAVRISRTALLMTAVSVSSNVEWRTKAAESERDPDHRVTLQ